MKHLKPEDYVVTDWSGGKTIQLAIAPEGAIYADRDFLWRLSSATVDLEESDFTPLPDYHRWIAPLDGEMILTHNGGEDVVLQPFETHFFDGADETHSRGKCTDFNLMLRKEKCKGEICSIRFDDTTSRVLHFDESTGTVILYCVTGSAAVTAGETVTLAPKESLFLDDGFSSLSIEAAPGTVLMMAEIKK